MEDPNRFPPSTEVAFSGSKPKAYGIEDLVEIEMWPAYNAAGHRLHGLTQPVPGYDFFACSLCLKIRSASYFSNAMMKSKRGKLGTGSIEQRSRRYCIPCGVSHGHYGREAIIRYGGAGGGFGSVCHKCGKFMILESKVRLIPSWACLCYPRYERRAYSPDYISMDCADWRDLDVDPRSYWTPCQAKVTPS
ncbi:conserved hypothetical protein [Microsporum canis CBS 113480]|uniref:Uncharacterized protein n=1 Tax=Arthroderma otae (strain ATCC MYA-4605 / CBS 113480) TaxID=554155 RepID=C5FUA5_ARTOC|nr:conserved hypothetical protein [Microsporum canis CBS 113480]EEQ33489.1 conserved hypothetical protein [Microsporum canis CBS 113480]